MAVGNSLPRSKFPVSSSFLGSFIQWKLASVVSEGCVRSSSDERSDDSSADDEEDKETRGLLEEFFFFILTILASNSLYLRARS